jgi:signal transduction histidine kinase
LPEPLPDAEPELTARLREALDRLGSPLEPIVAWRGPDAGLLISVPVAGRGWIVVAVADPHEPPGGWPALLSGMAVIVIGATALALRIAYKMTQPMHLLERAVASVGADGTLPTVPESGSAEVRATAQALNRLSARLRTAMESRMRLVAAAGHDLRTPMTRMRLRAEFVADEEERAGWLTDLDELDHIADSAIGLVREEVATAAPEAVRLDCLVGEVVEDLAALGRPIRIEAMVPVTIRAAPWSLKRALRNLAVNAATHGGSATALVEARGGRAVVTILDQGPGIPPELMDRVFEPFFQVDPGRRRNFSGAGLGLAIAREIIEREGGTLVLDNRPDGGLRQMVSFPEAQET